MIDAALALAAQGLRVFPVANSGTNKKPAIKRWQHLATNDNDQIRRWWTKTRFQDCNIGIHPIGLLVVDVDGPTGEANLKRLPHPLPDTIKIVSGNQAEPHHYQLVYRLPAGTRAIPRPLSAVKGFETATKIDVKGSGGYVVGPGSTHKTGGVYRWDREITNVHADATPAPDWMLDTLCGPEQYGNTIDSEIGGDDELVDVLINRFPIDSNHRRHHQTGRAVSWLVGKGFDAAKVCCLGERWLRSFMSETSAAETHRDLYDTVNRCFNELARGAFELMPDHQLTASQQRLPANAERWIKRLITHHTTATAGNQNTKRVLCSIATGLLEEGFLRALLLHCVEEAGRKNDLHRVKLTVRQLKRVFELVNGKPLYTDTFYRLRKRFITTFSPEGKRQKATGVELLELIKTGTWGRASEYKLTGLSDVLMETLSVQGVNDGRIGASDDAGRGGDRPVLRNRRPGGGPGAEQTHPAAGAVAHSRSTPLGAASTGAGEQPAWTSRGGAQDHQGRGEQPLLEPSTPAGRFDSTVGWRREAIALPENACHAVADEVPVRRAGLDSVAGAAGREPAAAMRGLSSAFGGGVKPRVGETPAGAGPTSGSRSAATHRRATSPGRRRAAGADDAGGGRDHLAAQSLPDQRVLRESAGAGGELVGVGTRDAQARRSAQQQAVRVSDSGIQAVVGVAELRGFAGSDSAGDSDPGDEALRQLIDRLSCFDTEPGTFTAP